MPIFRLSLPGFILPTAASSRRVRVFFAVALCALLALCASFPFRAHAQPAAAPLAQSSDTPSTTSTSPAPARIAFVDIDAIIETSLAVKNHISGLETGIDAKRKEIDAKVAEYRRLSDSLEKAQTILTDDEKSVRREKIKTLRGEIEDLQYQASKMIRQSENTLLVPVMDAIMKTTETVARREGFDLVVRGETVLYGAPSADLTARVIAELDTNGLLGLETPPAASSSPSDSKALPAAVPTPTLLSLLP